MPEDPRVLMVVGADATATTDARPGPRKDYLALAETTHATVLDRSRIGRSRVARLIARMP